jgi:PKD repeat protein
MKSLFTLVVAVSLLFFSFYTSAQDSPPVRCAADEYHEQQMLDPEYAAKFRQIRRLVHDQLQGRTPVCATPIIIPVAVHFSGSITNANPSCLQDVVNDQIAVLNADFGGYNSDISTYCTHAANCPADYDPTALAGGTCIQFCLATMNHPAGSSVAEGNPAITVGQYTFDSGAAPWAGYMNIFVSDVPPNGFSNNLLGLAPLGGGANPNGNGIFITASAFGGGANSCVSGIAINNNSFYNLGRTGTHEAGHYFSLNHIFDGCGTGDGIADTPAQSADNGGTPSINYENCTSTAANTCGTQDFFFNFMDYVRDVSMYMFTSDQSDLMNATATAGVNNGSNPYKTSATTCSALPSYNPAYPTGCPVATPPESAFSIDASAPYEFCPSMNQITFTDQSTDFPTAWSWTFSGAGVFPTSSTDQNPTIQVNSTGTLTVTLTASNSAGPDLTPATMSYAITILAPANCGNCGQTFYDSGGAGGNYANNEDVTMTYCSADPGDVVVANFSAINIGSSFAEDYILVKSGTTAASGLGDEEYLISLSNIYEPQGGGSYFSFGNTSITSSANCLTFRFLSDGSGTTAGWAVNISCIAAPSCSDLMQNQDEVFVDCGGTSCNPCPTPEDGFTFYDAGGPNNPTGTLNQTWQVCALNGNNTIVDFATIDMLPFNNGILRVYDGPDNGGNPGSYDYYISGSAVYVPSGPNTVTLYGSSTITSTDECFFFQFFNGASDSNGWAASVSASVALPLVLNDFRARPGEAGIDLEWLTEQEVNVDRFLIQRRDGSSNEFREVGQLSACGNCLYDNKYAFEDIAVRPGVNYTYRLKMLDFDGQYEYSNMVTTKINGNGQEWDVYPNPGRGIFTLWFNDTHNASAVIVVDPLGRSVYQAPITPEDRYIDLDLTSLEGGIYQLTVVHQEILTTKPLVIVPH